MATTRTRSKLPKLPYPDTEGDGENPKFWLRAWMRDQAQAEALESLRNKIWLKCSDPLLHGMCYAVRLAKKEAEVSLGYVKSMGVLLMAWHGTTFIHEGGAA